MLTPIQSPVTDGTAHQDTLNKLYVEITTHCNLSCEMCIQRVWGEGAHNMPLATFSHLMEQVEALPTPPVIHFGGYGEPMVHPDFLAIVQRAKATGAQVEMTTNGMMLTRQRAEALVELGLDKLVVSVDGVTPDSYSDVRVHGDLDRVIQNLRYLHHLKVRKSGRHGTPRIAIAFVAMKSNIAELPELARLASYIGAWEIKVSNVIPHTPEMETEILYEEALRAATFRQSRWAVNMSLPRIDLNPTTTPALHDVYDSRVSLTWMGRSWSERTNYCRFAHEGFAVVRADGEVSPCLSLSHTHPEYTHGRRRVIRQHGFGNVQEQDLGAIWHSDAFAQFRQQVRDFEFSPCTNCSNEGCQHFSSNVSDCTEHSFPTCGGCLWAQGIVDCP